MSLPEQALLGLACCLLTHLLTRQPGYKPLFRKDWGRVQLSSILALYRRGPKIFVSPRTARRYAPDPCPAMLKMAQRTGLDLMIAAARRLLAPPLLKAAPAAASKLALSVSKKEQFS